MALLLRFYPQLEGAIELVDVSTPLSIEHYLGAEGGGAVGLDQVPERFTDWSLVERLDARTPVEGLYLNAGWCYGGFKATPASGLCFAHLIARDEPHPVATAYRLDRFASGRVIDEKGMGAQPNLH